MKPVLFYCNTMPLLSIADQRQLIFLRKTMCSANPILCTFSRLCNYDSRALTATYNVNYVHASSSYIKSAVWMSFVDSLQFLLVLFFFCILAHVFCCDWMSVLFFILCCHLE